MTNKEKKKYLKPLKSKENVLLSTMYRHYVYSRCIEILVKLMWTTFQHYAMWLLPCLKPDTGMKANIQHLCLPLLFRNCYFNVTSFDTHPLFTMAILNAQIANLSQYTGNDKDKTS